MATYKMVMGVGIVVLLVGLLGASTVTIYYSDYPSTLDWPKTLGGAALRISVLFAGWVIYKWGERMRDGR